MTCDFSSVILLPPTLRRVTFRRPFARFDSPPVHRLRYRRVLGDDGCRLRLPHDSLVVRSLVELPMMSASTYLTGLSLHVALYVTALRHRKHMRSLFAASHFLLIFNFTSPQSGKPCSLLQSGHIIFTFIVDRFDGWKAVCEIELLSSYFILLIVFALRGRRSGAGLNFYCRLSIGMEALHWSAILFKKLTTSQVPLVAVLRVLIFAPFEFQDVIEFVNYLIGHFWADR
ncbi:hypothetical protein EVAR_32344_1 [Eumeta japonica]|uniref:Uncharacterized protein n=1 Tax=Eumeta variegata TaxID=151549 RepID=A0A4C1ZA44_EUMVA|nr:hypothetical protein EVAR_32344_1 [Eumeta japonica]